MRLARVSSVDRSMWIRGIYLLTGALVAMARMLPTGASGDGDVDGPVTMATTSPAPTGLNHDVITAARCRVRCLSLLKSSFELTSLSNVKDVTSLMRCLQDADCSTCLKPCNQPLLSLDHCEDVCKFPKEEKPCSESCRFLKEIKQTAVSGVCPLLHQGNVSRTDVACSGRSCASDKNCDKDWKCCTLPCGSICRRTVPPPHDDLPAVPEAPTFREKTKGGSVELQWNSVLENGTTGPVLYIIDSRWNIGKRHNEAEMTPWQQVTQTPGTSTVINDITPGHWYQFRVASVSIHGCRGSSLPSKAFALSKEPRKPGPPTNLTEGDTLIAGGRMTVTIRWFPPRKSDLPVTRYKLFWSKRSKLNAAQTSGNKEQRKVLPGNRLTHQIQNLDSDTTYIVQVQAICQYGDVKLKSEKTSIYITTYPLPKPADQYGVPSESAGTNRAHPTPAPVMALSVEKPFYDRGILKANVTWKIRLDDGNDVSAWRFLIHWSPEACIADSSVSDDSLSRVMSSTTERHHFVIYDLRTDCRYLVKVEPISSQSITGKAILTSFSTPACGQTEADGKLQPDCPSNAPRVPEEPPDLVHTFLISNSNITSKLSWGTPTSESQVIGYRVVWGPIIPSLQANPVIDKTLIFTKVLSKNVRSLSIGNLLEGTTYLVRVQAFTKLAQGRVASIQFATPLLQLSPIDQPYREVHNSEKKPDFVRRKGNYISNSTLATTSTQRMDRKVQRPHVPFSASSPTFDSFCIIKICLVTIFYVTSCIVDPV